jgi:hypothetical protein
MEGHTAPYEYLVCLKAGDTLIWSHENYTWRSEFRLLYGDFFDGRDYLIVVWYTHGGHCGGVDSIIVFSGDDYAEVPVKGLTEWDNYSITDNQAVVSINGWSFEIPLENLPATSRHGNWFDVEDGGLVEYFFYYINMRSSVLGFDYRPGFKAVYGMQDGEIVVVELSFVDGSEFYECQ